MLVMVMAFAMQCAGINAHHKAVKAIQEGNKCFGLDVIFKS
jgi:hypothetical protein